MMYILLHLCERTGEEELVRYPSFLFQAHEMRDNTQNATYHVTSASADLFDDDVVHLPLKIEDRERSRELIPGPKVSSGSGRN